MDFDLRRQWHARSMGQPAVLDLRCPGERDRLRCTGIRLAGQALEMACRDHVVASSARRYPEPDGEPFAVGLDRVRSIGDTGSVDGASGCFPAKEIKTPVGFGNHQKRVVPISGTTYTD